MTMTTTIMMMRTRINDKQTKQKKKLLDCRDSPRDFRLVVAKRVGCYENSY